MMNLKPNEAYIELKPVITNWTTEVKEKYRQRMLKEREKERERKERQKPKFLYNELTKEDPEYEKGLV